MEKDDIQENIKVFCRLRPELPEDNSQESQFYLTSQGNTDGYSSVTQTNSDGSIKYYSSGTKKEFQFKFDGVFEKDSNQDHV